MRNERLAWEAAYLVEIKSLSFSTRTSKAAEDCTGTAFLTTTRVVAVSKLSLKEDFTTALVQSDGRSIVDTDDALDFTVRLSVSIVTGTPFSCTVKVGAKITSKCSHRRHTSIHPECEYETGPSMMSRRSDWGSWVHLAQSLPQIPSTKGYFLKAQDNYMPYRKKLKEVDEH